MLVIRVDANPVCFARRHSVLDRMQLQCVHEISETFGPIVAAEVRARLGPVLSNEFHPAAGVRLRNYLLDDLRSDFMLSNLRPFYSTIRSAQFVVSSSLGIFHEASLAELLDEAA